MSIHKGSGVYNRRTAIRQLTMAIKNLNDGLIRVMATCRAYEPDYPAIYEPLQLALTVIDDCIKLLERLKASI